VNSSNRELAGETPRMVKIAAALVACHLALYALVIYSAGPTAYQLGQAFGKLIFTAIVAAALLRTMKYGWGVSVFLIAGMLAAETKAFFRVLEALDPATSAAGSWLLFAVVNLPLVAALLCLLPKASRAPFRARRNQPAT
jgi:hypothetical protein